MSAVTWRLEGLKELEQSLIALGDNFGFKAAQRQIVKKAMTAAMAGVGDAIAKAAPVQKAPRANLLPPPLRFAVKESFRAPYARDKRSPKITPGMFAIYVVGISSSKKLKAIEFGRVNRGQETKFEGKPFIKKTFNSKLSTIQTKFTIELASEIDRFTNLQRKRAARALRLANKS